MYHVFFIHSSVNGHLGCFHVLAIVNSASVNIAGTCILLEHVFLWNLLGSVIAASYVSSIFSFLRNLHTVLHSGCINIHPMNSVGGFPSLHTLYWIYCLWIFLIIAILVGVRWNLIVVLICISLIISSWTSFPVPFGHLYVFFGEMCI